MVTIISTNVWYLDRLSGLWLIFHCLTHSVRRSTTCRQRCPLPPGVCRHIVDTPFCDLNDTCFSQPARTATVLVLPPRGRFKVFIYVSAAVFENFFVVFSQSCSNVSNTLFNYYYNYVQVPRNEHNRLVRKRCALCAKNKKRVESTYFCNQCKDNPGLCLEPCFKKFHGY